MIKVALAFLLTVACGAAQEIKFPQDLDKLAAKAVETVDVTLDSSLIQLAARFLSDKDPDEARVKKVVNGLKGVYVKSFEFDEKGQYLPSDVEYVRSQLHGPGWSRIVGVRSRDRDNAEVFLKQENGVIAGLVIIAAEPKEFTIVNIVGTIDPEQLRDLGGHFGIPKIDVTTGKSTPAGKDE